MFVNSIPISSISQRGDMSSKKFKMEPWPLRAKSLQRGHLSKGRQLVAPALLLFHSAEAIKKGLTGGLDPYFDDGMSSLGVNATSRPKVIGRRLPTKLTRNGMLTFMGPNRKQEYTMPGNDCCPTCSKRFTHPAYLKKHIASCRIKPGGKLQCDECPNKYATKGSLNEHKKFKHKLEGSNSCGLCNKVFSTTRNLARHKNTIHQRGQRLSCEKCSKEYSREDYLKAHIKSEHVPVKCDICKEEVMGSKSLQEHKRSVHEIGEKLQCDECPNKYANKYSLYAHKKAKHELVKCDLCDEKLRGTYSLQVHQVSVHQIAQSQYNCDICSQGFSYANCFKRHMNSFHKTDQPLLTTNRSGIGEAFGQPSVVTLLSPTSTLSPFPITQQGPPTNQLESPGTLTSTSSRSAFFPFDNTSQPSKAIVFRQWSVTMPSTSSQLTVNQQDLVTNQDVETSEIGEGGAHLGQYQCKLCGLNFEPFSLGILEHLSSCIQKHHHKVNEIKGDLIATLSVNEQTNTIV